MNKKYTLRIFIILIGLILFNESLIQAQIQLGMDINGEAENDNCGYSISLSSDGKIVAIGAYRNDENGMDAGNVRIFEYQSGNWIQLGEDIYGEAAEDNSGYSVSLSSDGIRVAIGATNNSENGTGSGHVRIYEYEAGNWIQLGGDIDGEAPGDKSGKSVSLSSDGNRVAIGAFRNDGNGFSSGHVRIYEYEAGNWIQLGIDIDGEAVSDDSGVSVSLSSDGNRVAIGAPNNESSAGHVRVYEYEAGNWIQLGFDIEGETNYDYSGGSVSLSSDGNRVAIGASSNNNDNGNKAGHVRIYEYEAGNWIQLGLDIDGEAEDGLFGETVSLSSDGSRVAVGASFILWPGVGPGYVQVFEYQVNNWVQLATSIYGESTNEDFGRTVSLSGNGNIIAIGAPFKFPGGNVQIYNLEPNAIKNISQFSINIYPNPTLDKVNIEFEKPIPINSKFQLFDIRGGEIRDIQLDISNQRASLDLQNVVSGIYLVRVNINDQIIFAKIVKQ